jgi:hypothetical protein
VRAVPTGEAHPQREYHRQMNVLLSRLDEQQRRWYLAVESERLGPEADRLPFEITGVDEETIRRGREELAASLADRPVDRVRQPGAGRPPIEKDLTLVADLQELIQPETAGDPMTGQRRVRSSLRSLRDRLTAPAMR